MIINHAGKSYSIENWDEFVGTLLNAIGYQLEDEIVSKINELKLVDTGEFKRSISINVSGNELTISSDSPHSQFIEYGTAGTKKGVVDPFGERSRGANPSRKMPIKKQGSEWKLFYIINKRWHR